MALTEQTLIDRIEVLESGIVQVRQATRVMRDGEQIAQTYERWVLSPGDDVSGQPENVRRVCGAVWTDEVIAQYLAARQVN